MLKPAILFKDEIQTKFKELWYTDDLRLYVGERMGMVPEIHEDNWNNPGKREYAIVDKDDNVVGYIAFNINDKINSCEDFGLISFDKGNMLVPHDVYHLLMELYEKYFLITWSMIGDNPVKKGYIRFTEKMGGNIIEIPYGAIDGNDEPCSRFIFQIYNPLNRKVTVKNAIPKI